MSTRWIALLVASVALPSLASAQSPPPPVRAASIPPSEGPIYKIELMIVEGLGVSLDQMSSAPRDLVLPSPSETRATFADPLEGDAALARSTSPQTIAEALQSDQAGDLARSISALDSVSGEIISPAPRLTSKDDKWEALRDEIASDPQARIISAPTLSVIEKQEATVYVASQAVFEYLVPLGDKTFEARNTEPQELGIRLSLVVNPADEEEAVVLSPLQVEVTSLDGREPVKGLGLDVGKPIVSTRSIKTSLPIRFGEERMLPIPSGPNKAAVVILRVERVDPKALNPPKTEPNPIPTPKER